MGREISEDLNYKNKFKVYLTYSTVADHNTLNCLHFTLIVHREETNENELIFVTFFAVKS